MPKGREELRRGVRELVEKTSREMEALRQEPGEASPGPEPSDRPDRPLLRLVREPAAAAAPPASAPAGEPPTVGPPTPVPAPPVVPAPAAGPRPTAAPVHGVPGDASGVHPRKGVCGAYYINHACWEVPDAFCNQALHVCMLRDCPVYHLNRDELERRFAAKFSHLW